MNYLKDNELLNLNGGAVNKSLIFGLLALGTLVIGIIDGLLRPLKCK